MKFSLRHIYKYLTSSDYRKGRVVPTSEDELEFKPNKHWAKIEKGGSEWLHWTDYIDYDGNVFRIYDLVPDPGFPDAFLEKKENKDE